MATELNKEESEDWRRHAVSIFIVSCTALDQIFGLIFMCLVMALAIGLRKKGKRKCALITVGLYLSLIIALTWFENV